ncbi:MAG TPA: energy-coupling factor transporter transmembrane protein EcfT [Streptosporangiaceae bacterium]
MRPLTRIRRRPTARRAGVASVLMRELPGDSVLHRLWAGTKLSCLLLLMLVVLFFPGWPSVAVGAALILTAGILARVPRGALPRLPGWLWIFLLLTTVIAYAGHGLAVYVRSILVGVILLSAAVLVSWTTPLAQIAPAFATLGIPLKKLGLPVDEWAITIGLCLRSLPLLLDEYRVLFAARRLRARPAGTGGRAPRRRISSLRLAGPELVDILTATMAVSTRRAAEFGQAMTARGGTGHFHASRPSLSRSDIGALGTVLGACALIVGLSLG